MILRYNRFLTGIILIIGGLLIITLSATVILKTLILITSFIILFSAIPNLIGSSKSSTWKSFDFFDNLLMVILAVILIIFPIDYISKAIGTIIFGLSLINLIKASDKTSQIQKDLYRYIIALILILVDPVDITKLVCWIIGLLLIVTGIILLLDISIPNYHKPSKTKEPRKRSDVIDIDDYHVHDEK